MLLSLACMAWHRLVLERPSLSQEPLIVAFGWQDFSDRATQARQRLTQILISNVLHADLPSSDAHVLQPADASAP